MTMLHPAERDTKPKRKRENDLFPSLTLRVSVNRVISNRAEHIHVEPPASLREKERSMKPYSIAVLVLLPAIAALMAGGNSADAATIKFSGHDWQIRPSATNGGPGPNRWEEKNVSVDASGHLHLKLTERDGKWYCAELYTRKALGFGLYEFQVVGRLDRLDPNVVFGLFNYPEPDVGRDGTNEIDIEFSRWGHPSADIGNYTVWPVRAALKQTTAQLCHEPRRRGADDAQFCVESRPPDVPLGRRTPRGPSQTVGELAVRATRAEGPHLSKAHAGSHQPLVLRGTPTTKRQAGRAGCPFVQVHAEQRRYSFALTGVELKRTNRQFAFSSRSPMARSSRPGPRG